MRVVVFQPCHHRHAAKTKLWPSYFGAPPGGVPSGDADAACGGGEGILTNEVEVGEVESDTMSVQGLVTKMHHFYSGPPLFN